MARQDVVLVTIDCWRHDSLAEIDGLRSLTETTGWQSGDAVTMGPATNTSFPALLGSAPPTVVYNDSGAIETNYITLPDRLSAEGYQTAGFVGSNPFLGKFSDRFETFWNDGMRADGSGQNRQTDTTFRKAWRRLTFSPRVADTSVLKRASRWWREAPSPRFLWIHLMGLHGPYLPGWKRGL